MLYYNRPFLVLWALQKSTVCSRRAKSGLQQKNISGIGCFWKLGLGHQMSFFKAYKIKAVLSVHAQLSFESEKVWQRVCLLLWKHFLILKSLRKRTSVFSSFAIICWFSPVYMSWPAFGTIFRITGDFQNDFFIVTGDYLKFRTIFLQRVSRGIFWISKWGHKSKQTFLFYFLNNKEAKIL